METKKYTYAQSGMVFGTFIGGALGVLLFVFTQNALYLTITGLGLVIFLLIGAAKERLGKSGFKGLSR